MANTFFPMSRNVSPVLKLSLILVVCFIGGVVASIGWFLTSNINWFYLIPGAVLLLMVCARPISFIWFPLAEQPVGEQKSEHSAEETKGS